MVTGFFRGEGAGRMSSPAGGRAESLLECFCLAGLITLAFIAAPGWILRMTRPYLPAAMRTTAWLDNYHHLICLGLGLMLTAGLWRRSGLRLGGIRRHWRRTAVVCGLPVLLTGLVYPRLPLRPFGDQPVGMWLISPLAQDLVFAGYIYGRFEPLLGGYLHKKLPVRWALVVAALFFASYHLPNFQSIPAGYVVFQLSYTFLGSVLVGLSRQWTGSILYIALSHMAGNCIAWFTS